MDSGVSAEIARSKEDSDAPATPGCDTPKEYECRICRCPADEEMGPLIRACHCSGSMAFTHVGCLRKWACSMRKIESRPSGVDQLTCEICMEPYSATHKSKLSLFRGVGIRLLSTQCGFITMVSGFGISMILYGYLHHSRESCVVGLINVGIGIWMIVQACRVYVRRNTIHQIQFHDTPLMCPLPVPIMSTSNSGGSLSSRGEPLQQITIESPMLNRPRTDYGSLRSHHDVQTNSDAVTVMAVFNNVQNSEPAEDNEHSEMI